MRELIATIINGPLSRLTNCNTRKSATRGSRRAQQNSSSWRRLLRRDVVVVVRLQLLHRLPTTHYVPRPSQPPRRRPASQQPVTYNPLLSYPSACATRSSCPFIPSTK